MHREFYRCHQDLSWSNIGLLFGPNGLPSQFKLIDFGNSRVYTKQDYESYLDGTADFLENPFFKETYKMAVVIVTLFTSRSLTAAQSVEFFLDSDSLQGTDLRKTLVTLVKRECKVTLIEAVENSS